MGWQLTLYSVPPFVAALIAAVLVRYAYRYRSRSTALPFLLLMTAVGLWSLVYGLQVGFESLSAKLTLYRVSLTIATAVPPMWLFLTLRYANRETWLTPLRGAVLVTEPVLFLLVLWTSPVPGLVWRGVVLRSGSTPLLDAKPAIGYVLFISYAYVLVVLGIGVLLSVFLTGSRVNRRQSGLLVVGAVVPLSANALFTLGISPVSGLDLTTFTFTLTGVVFGFALFRYDFLDLAPAAYRNVSDVLGDGILVFDRDGALVEANDRADKLLSPSPHLGDSVSELLPVASFDEVDGTVLTGDGDDARRYYELRHATLDDRRDETVGHLVALEEITATKEYEQRLEVTNRVLRHNLRNEVNVVLGRAEYLQATIDEGQQSLERIRTAAERLTAVSEKARFIQSSMHSRDRSLSPLDVVSLAEDVAAEYRATSPDATITLDAPDDVRIRAGSNESIRTALDNLVENAIEHNDGDRPTVWITIERTDDWVTVRVADDGPGIPRTERDPVLSDTETQLEHGSSLGLWLTKWAVTAVGGEISFERNEPAGSVVVLRFQPADD